MRQEKDIYKIVDNHPYIWMLFIAILCYLRIMSTQVASIGMYLYLLEYLLIYFFIVRKKPEMAFFFLLISISISMEMDAFIYGDDDPPFNRFTIFGYRSVFRLTSFIILLLLYKKYKMSDVPKEGKKLLKFLLVLGVTGFITSFITYLFNDNGVANSPSYPFVPIDIFIDYLVLVSFFCSTFLIATNCEGYKFLESIVVYILIGVAIASFLSLVSGYNGWYGTFPTMLAPVISGLAPCILLFQTKNKVEKIVYFVVSAMLVIGSFVLPSVIGSKWYLVIITVIISLVFNMFHIKFGMAIFLLILFLTFGIPILIDYISDAYIENDLIAFKIKQAVSTLNIFAYDSFQEWFRNLDSSASSRIEEPLNVLMEYWNKPWYAIFGKGFGGSTLNHLHLSDWNTLTGFTEYQRKGGFYVELHESFAILLLRHGLLGLSFFFYYIIRLIKKFNVSSLAVFGLLWFGFYWSYCMSFRLGIVAMALTVICSSIFKNNYAQNIN